jgi:hypothetical protein
VIWLSWRQFRAQGLLVFGILAVIAIVFAATGPGLAHYYATNVATCADRGDCDTVRNALLDRHQLLRLLGTALVAVPGLLGIFWGAPLIARELETGTYRLAWTQSVTRTRWLAVKLGVVGLASMAAAGLFSLMVTWWSSPLDKVTANRFGAGNFGARGIVPISYAAFGFTLGVAAGLLIRRTLPAMAATLAAFLAVRVPWTLWVRPHLIPPAHLNTALSPDGVGFGRTSSSGPMTLMPNPPYLPNAWIYSTHVVDNAGHRLTGAVLTSTCPDLGRNLPPPPGSGGGSVRVQAPGDVRGVLSDCVTKLSANYHTLVSYQPASRYWLFQWYETGIFLGLAVVLAGVSFWWLRRHVN